MSFWMRFSLGIVRIFLGTVLCLTVVDSFAGRPMRAREPMDTVRLKELVPNSRWVQDSLLKKYQKRPLKSGLIQWMLSDRERDAAAEKCSYPETGGEYDHFRISSIAIRVLQPFGTDIFDPDQTPAGKIDKLLNSIHPTTRESRIRQQLLFKEGDLLDGELVSQTEYLLRRKSSVYDAFIWVRPDEADTGAVKLDVIVKDVFPLGGDLNISSSRVKFGLFNHNIGGYDQHVSGDGYYYTGDRTFGIDLNYVYPNFLGTFWDFDSRLYHNYENKSQRVALERTLNKKLNWTGGLVTEWGDKMTQDLELDSMLWVNRQRMEAYLGYAYRFPHGATSLWMLRVSDSKTHDINPVLSGLYAYEHRRSVLLSWSYFQEHYEKQSYIYRLGRIEDVPVGYGIYSTGGWEQSIVGNRMYLEASAQYAQMLGGGFVRMKLTGSTFYHPDLHLWQQGMLESVCSIASPLYYWGSHRFRWMSEVRHLKGYARLPEESLQFFETEHVRGADKGVAQGNQRLLSFNELNWYLPYKLIGFKMIGFVHADAGWVGDKSLFASRPQIALGGGFRVRNDHLVINTIQITLSYYPSLSEGSKGRLLQLNGTDFATFSGFYPGKPEVAEYK